MGVILIPGGLKHYQTIIPICKILIVKIRPWQNQNRAMLSKGGGNRRGMIDCRAARVVGSVTDNKQDSPERNCKSSRQMTVFIFRITILNYIFAYLLKTFQRFDLSQWYLI